MVYSAASVPEGAVDQRGGMVRFGFLRFVTAAVLVAPLMLAGCSHKKDEPYVEQPVDQLYNKAMNLLDQHDWQGASKAFDDVDQQHPNSVWATRAQLMSAYALYRGDKQDEAVVDLDRFIQLHPAYKDTPYAYYLKALCYYEQIADVQRDQKITEQALASLQEVVTRYPDSRYARDAKYKLDLTRDQLAGKELAIGRFYEGRHQYLAAINRYRNVIEKYQTTTEVPEALERLVECYEALGLADDAKKVAAVLGYNFPASTWYKDSYSLATTNLPASALPFDARPDQAKPEQPAAATANAPAAPPADSGWFDWVPWPF
jgi:outer membrane protein assembly factor BamD